MDKPQCLLCGACAGKDSGHSGPLYPKICWMPYHRTRMRGKSLSDDKVCFDCYISEYIASIVTQKVHVMSNKPPSNVKIYDRPEKKAPSPIILVIGVLIALIVAFCLYKAFYHPAAPSTPTQPGILRVSSAFERRAKAYRGETIVFANGLAEMSGLCLLLEEGR